MALTRGVGSANTAKEQSSEEEDTATETGREREEGARRGIRQPDRGCA